MNRPKRHHFVPQFYLRRFANPKDQIVVFDRQRECTYKTAVTNVAVEAHYYTVSDLAGQPTEMVELALAELDGQAASIMSSIDRNLTPPNGVARTFLAHFIALQMVRTRGFRNTLDEWTNFSTKLSASLNLPLMTHEQRASFAREAWGREPTHEDFELMNRIPELLDTVRLRMDNNEYLALVGKLATLEVAPRLAQMSWHLLTFHKPGFLTGDQPVVLWREQEEEAPWAGVGIATADALYYPLDPEKVLMIGPNGEGVPTIVNATPRWVRDVNQLVASSADVSIFHHPKHRPLEGIEIPPQRTVFMVNGKPVTKGQSQWQEVRNEALTTLSQGNPHYTIANFGVPNQPRPRRRRSPTSS